MSWPRPVLRAMFGSMVLLQLGSVLMSVAQVTTKGHVAASRQLECLRAMLLLGHILI